jgi:hypothetical protein
MRQPSLGPSWTPLTHPPAQPRLWPRIRRQLLLVSALFTVALFTGLLRTSRGLLVVALAWVVLGLLGNHRAAGSRQITRAVVEYAAVAGLVAALMSAGATPPVKVTADPKPLEVDATQSPYLDQVRQGVVNLWSQIAQGFPEPPPFEQNGGRP